MWDVAGDVFEIVGPRPADDDRVDGTVQIGQAEIRWVQEDDTGMKLCRSIPVPSERIRAQPAILYYRVSRHPARAQQDAKVEAVW